VDGYTTGQIYAFHQLAEFYTRYFGPLTEQTGLRRPAITDEDEIHRLTAYFAWSAWAAAATRPGAAYSYTNNWPSEPMAANTPTAEAILCPLERTEPDYAVGRNGVDAFRRRPLGSVGLASGR